MDATLEQGFASHKEKYKLRLNALEFKMLSDRALPFSFLVGRTVGVSARQSRERAEKKARARLAVWGIRKGLELHRALNERSASFEQIRKEAGDGQRVSYNKWRALLGRGVPVLPVPPRKPPSTKNKTVVLDISMPRDVLKGITEEASRTGKTPAECARLSLVLFLQLQSEAARLRHDDGEALTLSDNQRIVDRAFEMIMPLYRELNGSNDTTYRRVKTLLVRFKDTLARSLRFVPWRFHVIADDVAFDRTAPKVADRRGKHPRRKTKTSRRRRNNGNRPNS